MSVAHAARDLAIHDNMLRKCVKDFTADPQHAFPGQGPMNPEQLEIERLRPDQATFRNSPLVGRRTGPDFGTSIDEVSDLRLAGHAPARMAIAEGRCLLPRRPRLCGSAQAPARRAPHP